MSGSERHFPLYDGRTHKPLLRPPRVERRGPDNRFFPGFHLLPLSLQNLALEFRSVLLVVSLCPRGVIPDAAYPLNPLLVSSHESF